RRAARHLFVEGSRELIELCALECQPGGHRVAAEPIDETGMTRGDRIEHVADVDAGRRARRATQHRRIGARKGDHRPPHALLHAARDEPHDTLVPALVEQTYAAALHRAGGLTEGSHRAEGPLLPACLDGATLLVERL